MRNWIHSLTHKHSSRRAKRHASKHVSRSRRAAFEPLEDRRLLSVAPEWLTTLDAEGTRNAHPNMPYIAGHAAGGFSTMGVFQGNFDLDPGAGELILSSVVEGSQDTVIARYTDEGEVLWATQIGGTDYQFGWNGAKGVATDRLGNTYILGEFKSSVQIGGQSFTGDEIDGYVAKLDANGNFVWAQPLRASNSAIVEHGRRRQRRESRELVGVCQRPIQRHGNVGRTVVLLWQRQECVG